MVLINTYENQHDAELALDKLKGEKRLASERDDNEVIYNLFGLATWTNLYAIDLFKLKELEGVINGNVIDENAMQAIRDAVEMAARIFSLEIPKHWKEVLNY